MLRIRGPSDASFLHFQIKAACSLFRKKIERTICSSSIDHCHDIIIFRDKYGRDTVLPRFFYELPFLSTKAISTSLLFFHFVIRYNECNILMYLSQ